MLGLYLAWHAFGWKRTAKAGASMVLGCYHGAVQRGKASGDSSCVQATLQATTVPLGGMVLRVGRERSECVACDDYRLLALVPKNVSRYFRDSNPETPSSVSPRVSVEAYRIQSLRDCTSATQQQQLARAADTVGDKIALRRCTTVQLSTGGWGGHVHENTRGCPV